MGLKKGEWFLLLFNIAYLAVSLVYYISIKNYEFLWYIFVVIILMILIAATIKRSKFDYTILWGLSIWGLLHMAGGGIYVGEKVLYGLQMINIVSNGEMTILRFDQFVHFFGFAVSTLVVYHLLKFYLKEDANYKIIYPLVAIAGIGLGALNEVVEFIAVISFDKTGVGGYFNTALDLFFNTLGAIAAVVFIHFRRGISLGIR